MMNLNVEDLKKHGTPEDKIEELEQECQLKNEFIKRELKRQGAMNLLEMKK